MWRKSRLVEPEKEITTIRFKQKAKFEGEEYTVYGKVGSEIRTIFPRLDKHPSFAAAPFGARFKVWWRGRWYSAVKSARWQENMARVPCLDWEVGE